MNLTKTENAPTPTDTRGDKRVPKYLWALLLVSLFLLYSNSFAGFQVLEQQHSVLADGDVAQFSLLIREFDLKRKYGDEYRDTDRGLGDIAQKHKIHHIVYVAVASVLLTLLAPLYGLFGIPGQAVYGVNAIIACVNISLVYVLLRRYNQNNNPLLPFVLFYAFALNTWIFASVPESWPFSATLVLCFLLLNGRVNYLTQGAIIGVAMLNNIFLSLLWLLHVVELYRQGYRGRQWVGRAFASGVCAVAVWTVVLTALSVFDGSFRPDHFIQYTLWFREFAGGGTPPLTDPYVWMSAITNLFVNAVTSNQPDPKIPQEAIAATLRGSRIGLASIVAYILLMGCMLVQLARSVRARVRAGGVTALLEDRSTDAALYAAIMTLATVVLFYSAGFLYASVVIPMIALLLGRHLDLTKRTHAVLLAVCIILMIINNTSQVLQFRAALAGM